MPQIHISQALFEQIEKLLPEAMSLDDFVLEAVHEKLSSEDRKQEFYRLSDQTRAAMAERGVAEVDVLADFELTRDKSEG